MGLFLAGRCGIYFFTPGFFPDKPILFARSVFKKRLRQKSMAITSIWATYPIGIFAESYANFGIPGVCLALFLLGFGLKYWYSQCLAISHTDVIHWKSLVFTVLYATLCSNSLPYMRSLGQFLALLLLGLLLLIAVGFIQWVGRAKAGPTLSTIPHEKV